MTGHDRVVEDLRAALVAAITAVEPLLEDLDDPASPAATCTWCPVCALAALLRGERHPLLTAVRDHGIGILTMMREVLGEAAARHGTAAGPDGTQAVPQPGAGPGGAPEPEAGRSTRSAATGFQRIDVTIRHTGEAER